MREVRVATFAGPGTAPEIQSVPYPQVPARAGLIEVEAFGVCGTDLHILQGHWPKPLPWSFSLDHEVAGVLADKGEDLKEDYIGQPLEVGCRVMIPPLMPYGECHYCRYILLQSAAPMGWLGRNGLLRPADAPGDRALASARRYVVATGIAVGTSSLLHPRPQSRRRRQWLLGR